MARRSAAARVSRPAVERDIAKAADPQIDSRALGEEDPVSRTGHGKGDPIKALFALLAVTSAALLGAVTVSAGPPTVRRFSDTFVDVNPCTGLLHTVTINVTQSVVSPVLDRGTHEITTSSGVRRARRRN